MKDIRTVSTSWTDLTRDSAVYLLFTFSAIKVSQFIYRCFQSSEMSSFSMETHPEALRRERILSSKLYFNVPESKVSYRFCLFCVCVSNTIQEFDYRVCLFDCLNNRFRSSIHQHTTSRSCGLRSCEYIYNIPQNL